MPTLDNKKLLVKVAAGEEEAFRHLYDLFADKVYTMAVSYLKSPLDAQDVIQDVFLKVWEKRNALTEVNNIAAWLHVLTRNHLINLLQKKIPSRAGENTSLQDTPAEGQEPGQQLDIKEMSSLICAAVNGLPHRQQQVYRLSREQGMTLQQIAASLGLSYDTIREHMNYALKNIRFYLQRHYGKTGPLLILFLLQQGI
ncbi:MAG TPA: RNA polymerase sigma-70 factor [Chitinophagaceae bacterium]|nr:RNA polymerase sigma-70 factor [Chitinophagaceae bacterium]